MRKRKTEVSALPAVDADENGGVAIAEGEERVELSALRENPDNPQTVTEEEFGKLRDSMRRIHHHVKWENCAAKIISARWRKGSGGR